MKENKHSVEILLIEDNEDEANLVIRSLKENNIANTLVHIDDGAEALDYIYSTGEYAGSNTPVYPKLILLDINLPKISGLEILRKLKTDETTKMIPVVMLTSSTEQKDIIDSYKLGVNSYIVKPVNFKSFSKAIGELNMYWTVLNQSPINE